MSTNDEVMAGLRVVGAVARADGKISDKERAVFREAVTDFSPSLEDGTSIEKLLTEPSDLDADLAAVTSPVVRRAVFEIAFAMSAIDGATKEEGDVLKRIRKAYEVQGEPGVFSDMLKHNWAHDKIEPTLNAEERTQKYKTILARRTTMAALMGAIPLPFISDVGVLIQIRALVDEIAILWGVPLTAKEKWSTFGALLGIAMAQSAAHSLLKSIPGWGTVVGSVSGAVGSYAVVGAIGGVVNYHFEKDGKTTPEELRAVFKTQKAEMKNAYAGDKARIDRAREQHGAELEALSKQLEAKELTPEAYDQKVAELLRSSS